MIFRYCDSFPLSHSHMGLNDKEIGLLICIGSHLALAVALNMQKIVYVRAENPKTSGLPYYSQPLWWFGLLGMILGELGNFFAYAWGPIALIVPLGSLSVVFNVFLAACMQAKSPLSARTSGGSLIAVLGVVLVYLAAPESHEPLTWTQLAEELSATVFVTTISLLLALVVWTLSISKSHGAKHLSVPLISAVGTGTVSVLIGKALAEILRSSWSDENYSFVRRVPPYVMMAVVAAFTVIQQTQLNLALSHFGSRRVLPPYFTSLTLLSVATGVLLFGEWTLWTVDDVSLGATGLLLTCSGVWIITSRPDRSVDELLLGQLLPEQDRRQ